MLEVIISAAFAAAAGVVGHSRKSAQGCKDQNKSEQNIAVMSHRLTDAEANFYKHDVPYICTLTWLRGDYQSAKIHLQERLDVMIQKNPWLRGHIVFNRMKGKCDLTYTYVSDKDDSGNKNNSPDEEELLVGAEVVEVIPPSSSPISRDVPFTKLNSRLRDFGLLINNGPQEPVFKVTIIPCSERPRDRFALLVQLSHVVGDGATYYKLLHMLCGRGDDRIVEELIPERIIGTKEQQIEALGGEAEASYFTSAGNIMRILSGLALSKIRGKRTQFHYAWIDNSEMKEMKESEAREAGVSFLSTNDIITSWYMTHAACPMGVMTINWRNRLEGHTDLHAGDYENMIFYHREDFATPALIRQSLTNFRRAVTYEKRIPFPSWWEIATSSGSVVTNWATFAKPMEVEGCEEDIHLPLLSEVHFPPNMPTLVLFQASAGIIGLAYMHSNGVDPMDNAPFLEKKKEVN